MPRMGKTVLVVEDEQEYRILLESVLGGAGYRVLLAANGAEGLRLFEAESPDVILLDVVLPDVLGYELCARIRATKGGADVPILFCTVRSAVKSLAEGVNAGGTDYVLKPFVPENVLARVKASLRPAK